MNLEQDVLTVILQHPGTSKRRLSRMFSLSSYRLHRVFRLLERDLENRTLIHDENNGVWIVDIEPDRCHGVDWHGPDDGGYRQCVNKPKFPDSRCYVHSEWESSEMTAFRRELECLVSPCDPSAYHLGQLTLTIIEEMLRKIAGIRPMTLQEELARRRFQAMLKSAFAFLTWKDMMRRRRQEQEIPPEFFERHRSSSVRPMEFAVKKLFLILEVPPTSTREEVLKAWRKLARKFHPDTENGNEEKMKELNHAKDRIFRIRRWD
jgi:DnaJ-domain-containing protein 1